MRPIFKLASLARLFVEPAGDGGLGQALGILSRVLA